MSEMHFQNEAIIFSADRGVGQMPRFPIAVVALFFFFLEMARVHQMEAATAKINRTKLKEGK